MTTRRTFLKGFGFLGGAAATGVTGMAAATSILAKDRNITKQLEEQSNGITINNTYGITIPQNPNSQLCFSEARFVEGTKNKVGAKLVVGPDGEFHVFTNGKWSRIVTE